MKQKEIDKTSSNNNELQSEKRKIIIRLNIINGQINGINRMVRDDRNLNDILMQILATERALRKVSFIIRKKQINNYLTKNVVESRKIKRELNKFIIGYN